MAALFSSGGYYRGDNALNLAGRPFSYACWLKMNSIPGGARADSLMFAGNNVSFNVEMQLLFSGGVMYLRMLGSGSGGIVPNPGISPTTQWIPTLCVVHASGAIDAYISTASDSGLLGNPLSFGTRFGLGARCDDTPNDILDDAMLSRAAVWAKALSAAEINAYQQGLHPYRIAPQYLRHYWPLFNKNNAVAIDSVGGLHLNGYVSNPTLSELAHPRRGGGA